jgi:hypothetical protein
VTTFHVAAGTNSKSILNQLLLLALDQHCSSESASPKDRAKVLSVVDIRENFGQTPLWWAAYYGYEDCVDVLLLHGADPDHRSNTGESPLDIAKKKGYRSIISKLRRALMESGRQPEQQSKSAEADRNVTREELVKVAKEVAGDWEELSVWLLPDFFTLNKRKEIKQDQDTAFCRALTVLEMWVTKLGGNATCQLLIHALCQMDQRAIAAQVFGFQLVDILQSL